VPRRCTVCAHPERDAVDAALIARQPFQHIVARFGLSTSALVRHHDDHLPAAMAKSARAAEISRGDDLIDRVIMLAQETQAVLDRSKEAHDDAMVLRAVGQAAKLLELQGQLLGRLQAAPTINIVLSAEWLSLQTLVVAALEPHPTAKADVIHALEKVHVAGHG
jgi:hypothetical protein